MSRGLGREGGRVSVQHQTGRERAIGDGRSYISLATGRLAQPQCRFGSGTEEFEVGTRGGVGGGRMCKRCEPGWDGKIWKAEVDGRMFSWRRCYLFRSAGDPCWAIEGMRVCYFIPNSNSPDPFSIVEFGNSEDAKKAKAELADKQFMGRSLFIREVRFGPSSLTTGPRGNRSIRCTPYSGQDRNGDWRGAQLPR
jgi:hypothetical protein